MSVSPASWHSPDPAPSSTPTASSTGQAFAARATRLRAKPAAPHAAPTGADHSRRRWPAGWTRVPAPRVTAPITPSTASRFEPRSTSSGSDDTDMAGKAYTQNAVGATTSQKAGADPVGSRSWTSRPGRGPVTGHQQQRDRNVRAEGDGEQDQRQRRPSALPAAGHGR